RNDRSKCECGPGLWPGLCQLRDAFIVIDATKKMTAPLLTRLLAATSCERQMDPVTLMTGPVAQASAVWATVLPQPPESDRRRGTRERPDPLQRRPGSLRFAFHRPPRVSEQFRHSARRLREQLLIDDEIAPEDRIRLVTGDLHRDRLLHAGPDE